jgi:hypothetical protein
MSVTAKFLPGFCRGGEPAKLVEGYSAVEKNPSTILRAVARYADMLGACHARALPTESWGGIP